MAKTKESVDANSKPAEPFNSTPPKTIKRNTDQ